MVKILSLNRSLLREGGKNFTLENVIAAKPDEFATCSVNAKVKIQQARRSIEIDQDVVDALRRIFGNMPLGKAIRIMLGLKPKVAQNAWQEEEDALIRKHYPLVGGPPLAKVLGRSADCVRDRAHSLGVKRVWQFGRVHQKQVDRYVKRNPVDSRQLVSMIMLRYPLSRDKAEVMVMRSFKRLGIEKGQARGDNPEQIS